MIMITYECRDIGYGVESGEVIGIWTGETDASGKSTFVSIDGVSLYLFPDEVLSEDCVVSL